MAANSQPGVWRDTRVNAPSRAVILLLAVALLSACTGSSSGSGGKKSTTSHPAPGVEAIVTEAAPFALDDLTVTRTDGGPLPIAVAPAPDAPDPLEGARQIGDAVSIESGTEFSGTVRLSWKVPEEDLENTFIAYDTGAGWTPAATLADAVSSTVSVDTDHLSIWGVFTSDAWSAVSGIAAFAKDVVGLGDIGSSPRCDRPLPAGTVTVDTSSGKSFKVEACAMLRDGKFVVRLANRRALTVTTSLPAGAHRSGGSIPSAGDLAAGAVDKINMSLSDQNRMIVPSGGWSEITWDSVPAQPVSFGIDTDNGNLVWSLLFTVAGNSAGAWKILSGIADGADALSELSNRDLAGGLRLALTEYLEDTGKVAGVVVSVPKLLVAAVVGSVIMAVRGLIDSFRSFGDGTAKVKVNPPATGGDSAWSVLRSAKIPAMCTHDPTQLVDGRDVTIGPNEGHFELLRKLANGNRDRRVIR